MSVAVSQGVPSSITIGDSVSFTVNNADYPVGDWPTATIVFRNGSNVQSFTGTVDELDQLFELDGAATGLLTAGRNFAAIVYTDEDGNRASTEWTEVDVNPDPTAAFVSTFASRSLAKIETAIEQLSSGTNMTVNFNGQSFTKRDMRVMMEMRDQLAAEVANEQSGLTLGITRSGGIRTRFAIPT